MSTLSMTRGNTALFQTTVANLGSGGLTGFSAWFTAKRDASDADSAAVFQKTILAGGIAITTNGGTGVNGVLTTTVAPVDTETLPTGYSVLLVYDVKVKDTSGVETTVDSGTITVKADVTQAV
ncbi:MAG: hypothetical protein ACXWP0_03685 [Ktedonobacterales bacterium]